MQPTDPKLPKMLTLTEIGAILIKHFGYNEGLFEVSFALAIGVGPINNPQGELLPGAAFGISSVGLAMAEKAGPLTINAAEVNPMVKRAVKPAVKSAKRAAKMPRKSA